MSTNTISIKSEIRSLHYISLERMTENRGILIIGGGLSGLTLAHLLFRRNINTTILEAAPRLGGRILTKMGELETPLELGATWFSDIHTNLLSLIKDLGLSKYPQYSKGTSLFQTKSFEPPQKFHVPESENPSYRLVGGTETLIRKLEESLPEGTIELNSKVILIKESKDGMIAETDDGREIHADKIVICIPPQLACGIAFSPVLPEAFYQLLPTVQTWMAGSIKFTLEYNEPFWRNQGFSGMLYSHAGIIMEMYDHTNYEENKFGFTGFLNPGAANYSTDVRREYVLNQLEELLGPKASQPIAYFDKVWNDEFILSGSQIIQRPHQNNGHTSLQASYMKDKLYFGATETATEFPGYMEGAIVAAKCVANKIK